MLVERCSTVFKIDYSTVAENPDALVDCKLLNRKGRERCECNRSAQFESGAHATRQKFVDRARELLTNVQSRCCE